MRNPGRRWRRVPLALAALAVASELAAQPTSPVTTPAAVRSISLDVTAEPERGLVRVEADLGLEGTGATFVELALDPGLVVERVSGRPGSVEHRHAAGALRLHLDPPLEGRRTVRVTVTGRPRAGDGDRITPAFVALDPSLSWYPMPPDGLHLADVTLRLPAGWTAAGPRPTGRSDDGVHRFRPERPVRGIALVAAPGLGTETAEIAGRRLTVVAGSGGPEAGDLASLFSDPMAWFSGALAPYPFDGLDVAVVPGLPATVVGSGVLAFPEDEPPATRGDAAHALAGQWYGQWLAGDGPWIRAFAAWHARTYAIDRRLPPAARIEDARGAYFELAPSRDVALARAGASAPDAVVVGKGSAAPEMVRLEIGSRAFAAALADILALAPSTISADDVRAAIRTRAGPDGAEAFDDWFLRAGVPSLRALLRVVPAAGGGFRADVRLEQRGRPYRLTVPIVLRGVDAERRETLRTSEERLDVFYVLPFRPARLEVDPAGTLFQRPPEITPP